MPKPKLEIQVDDIPWTPLEGAPGMYEKILAIDPDTGDYTRLLKMEPGVEINKEISHDFWEEVLLIEGEIVDCRRDTVVSVGFYCCLPPGTVHGLVKCPKGAITFETRYYKKQ